jgi:hypothetical protein
MDHSSFDTSTHVLIKESILYQLPPKKLKMLGKDWDRLIFSVKDMESWPKSPVVSAPLVDHLPAETSAPQPTVTSPEPDPKPAAAKAALPDAARPASPDSHCVIPIFFFFGIVTTSARL